MSRGVERTTLPPKVAGTKSENYVIYGVFAGTFQENMIYGVFAGTFQQNMIYGVFRSHWLREDQSEAFILALAILIATSKSEEVPARYMLMLTGTSKI